MNIKKKFTDSMKTVDLVEPSIYVSRRTLNRDYPLHKHSFFEIEFFLRGTADNVVDGTKHTVVAGSVCIYTPSNFHEIKNIGEKLEYFHFGFDETLISSCEFAARLVEKLPIIVDISPTSFEFSHLAALFEGLNHEYFGNSADKNAYLKYNVELIMILLLHFAAGDSATHGNGIADAALMYIRRNFKRKITLNEIAEYVHCSPCYLSSLFRNVHKRSVVEYINDMRLTYARNVISTDPQISITELCYSLGYKSYSYFSRSFKTKFGFPPRTPRDVPYNFEGLMGAGGEGF